MTLIIFLVILGVLIFSHELGHFLAARATGIKVHEFGLGFPPRLFGWRRGETLYSLNIIPLGGFVKIHGEDPEELASDDQRAMFTKPKPIQALVLLAGIIFNLILAWLLVVITLSTVGLPIGQSLMPGDYELSNPQLLVASVINDSPAETAGLQVGDVIVSARTRSGAVAALTPTGIGEFTADRAGEEIVIGYRRQAAGVKDFITEVGVVPTEELLVDRAAIGLGLEMVGRLKLALPAAFIAGSQLSFEMVRLTGVGLGQLFVGIFRGEAEILKQVAGPVGLVSLVGDATALGFGYLLFFTALISINLALLNLLPIPALDGGRLLFLIIEAIKGSPIKPTVARTINFIGFVFILLLMVLVTVGDISRLF